MTAAGARLAADVVDDLQHAAMVLRKSGDNRVGYIADGLERYAAGEGDLHSALGLQGQAGKRSFHTQATFRRRAEAIHAAAKEFFPGQRVAAQADAIATAMLRYATSAWLRERNLTSCPPRYGGHLNAFLWAALRADPRVPSARTIRRILATK